MRITNLFLTIVLLATLGASAQTAPSQTGTSTGGATLTGCLKGSPDQFYLVDKNGHKHTLQGKNEDLSQHVDHIVTVTGKASPSRVSGSDAEGHRKGYFSVTDISDQGPCTK